MHSGLILLLSAWALACAASAEPSADVSAAAGLRALAADGEEALLRTCASILSSKNAQFFEDNVALSRLVDSEAPQDLAVDLMDSRAPNVGYEVQMTDPTARLERIVRALRSSVYAPKLCDPDSFFPRVLDQTLSCAQICGACVPGSAAVCHRRNPRFPGVAQTCFCTYDEARPLHNAVLVLRNGVSQI